MIHPIIGEEKVSLSAGAAAEVTVNCRAFLIKNNGAAPVPSSQILYNQAIIDGIAKSAAAGREVAIVIPEI